MKAKDFIPASKPRNPYVRNAKTSGAGAHKDKKKAAKQGDIKHKKQEVDESVRPGEYILWNVEFDDGTTSRIRVPSDEITTPEIKAHYAKQGKTVVKADTDWSIHGGDEFEPAPGQRDLDRQYAQQRNLDQAQSAYDRQTPEGIEQYRGRSRDAYQRDYDSSVSGFGRRERDWDEGDKEPPNNFAVYINGKKWKVFKGRGHFADDYKEIQHYRQLQTWAEKKSASTGKKWSVHITGEAPTE